MVASQMSSIAASALSKMGHDVVAASSTDYSEPRSLQSGNYAGAADDRKCHATSGTVILSSSGTPNSLNHPSRA